MSMYVKQTCACSAVSWNYLEICGCKTMVISFLFQILCVYRALLW